jgi:predicted ATP-grasp superfamily ATP-dependent carboligase
VSVAPDRALEEGLLRLLDGRDGIFMAQLVDDVLLDLNPRVYGSLPLAVAAGVNLAALWCDLARGIDVPARRGRAGVTYRWLEGDVRHVLAQTKARAMTTGDALRALRPRRGVAHPVASLRDPGPLLARLRFSLGRLRD